jgi:hypothetical protein
MNQDLRQSFRDWRAADEAGRDEAADAACRDLFESVMPPQGVSAAFTARTMTAITEAAAQDARRARRTRVAVLSGSVASGLVLAYFGLGVIVSAAPAAVSSLVTFLVGALVRIASAMQAGVSVWGVLTAMGSAAWTFVSDPKVTFFLIAIQGVAVAALLWLQRLVDSERELVE